MTEEDARYYISIIRPTAKFTAFSHTDDFLPKEAEIGKGYYYVSLYDEVINSNLIETPEGVIMIGNTYLSSFAYNIVLCWIYEYRNGKIGENPINPMIKYNCKKFFAEQLNQIISNVFSRAIFLETLLYEQQLMIPVFKLCELDANWAKIANAVSGIMSNIILFHEMGHYYNDFLPNTTARLFDQNAHTIKHFINNIEIKNSLLKDNEKVEIEELKCDIFGLYSRLILDEQDKTAMVFTLRSAAIGYASLALLYSLQESAKKTAHEQSSISENFQFKTIIRPTTEYSYYADVKRNVVIRARYVIELCELIANHEGLIIYGNDGMLPLSEGILGYLLSYVNSIIDEGMTTERAMAKLVAEALHNHPDGMEYLNLNSKQYQSNRPLTL